MTSSNTPCFCYSTVKNRIREELSVDNHHFFLSILENDKNDYYAYLHIIVAKKLFNLLFVLVK